MKWNSIETPVPPNVDRVLVYTPNKDATMRYRVIDPRFLKTIPDATHWVAIVGPKKVDCKDFQYKQR